MMTPKASFLLSAMVLLAMTGCASNPTSQPVLTGPDPTRLAAEQTQAENIKTTLEQGAASYAMTHGGPPAQLTDFVGTSAALATTPQGQNHTVFLDNLFQQLPPERQCVLSATVLNCPNAFQFHSVVYTYTNGAVTIAITPKPIGQVPG